MMGATKTCSKCGETKPIDLFAVDNHRADGWSNWCLACHNASVQRQSPEQRRATVNRHRENPANRKKDRMSQRAKDRARARLAERYVEVYADLLDEERERLGLPPVERRRLAGW